MSKDVECPYCKQMIDINHDDGYGFEEDVKHEQYCHNCEKYFVYTTSIIYIYESYKADCLNDSQHNYKPTKTFPTWATKMRCTDCEHERELTEEERKKYKDVNRN
jgi:hypothetical protein